MQAASQTGRIEPERIEPLNDAPPRTGRYVLYWMQQAQRADGNHALEFAVAEADRRQLPVLVVFGLTPAYPEANARHYAFLLEGLAETGAALRARGIGFVLAAGAPDEVAVRYGAQAALAVTDAGYLAIQRRWRRAAAHALACPLFQVETDVVVPLGVASDHEEYGARTLRPKIHKHLERFLAPLVPRIPRRPFPLRAQPVELDDTEPTKVLAALKVDATVAPVSALHPGGVAAARRRLARFVRERLPEYATHGNDPVRAATSDLSPYLHYGQISPVEIARAVRAAAAPAAARDAFLEQLIVRRELSMNFVACNHGYDRYETAVPAWAQRSLRAHAADPREYVYAREIWERAATHDPYWNAAQREMLRTGKMHNYMRMYWGKKLIEWSASPAEAFATALYLNNRYELDGRDANGYAGVAWCFGKHDRPWRERPVFGQIRYMNAAGLRRKFKIERYVAAQAAEAAP